MPRVLALCMVIAAAVPLYAGEAGNAQVRESVLRGIGLIQKSQAAFNVPCVSCHHHGLGMLALEAARSHGIPVDEKAAQVHVAKAFAQVRGYEGAIEGSGGIDSFAHGYGLLALHAANVGPNIVTSVLAKRFSSLQLPDGHWAASDARPPHSESVFTATALGARVLGLYLPRQYEPERRVRFARTTQWLLTHQPHSTEDASYRLLGLFWAGARASERKQAARDLLSKQHPNGGWSQVPGMATDSYSTGQALFALHQAGAIRSTDTAFRKGIQFLLDTQRRDGSWLVKSRLHSPAPISPPFFDAGFPNGKDQFISFAGTCWAVMGLMQALPEVPKPVTPLPVPQVQPDPVEHWVDTALFGTAEELKALLDSGLNANAATKGGVTLLMMAVPDVNKVKLLLDHGAKVNAKRPSGATALSVAATYGGSSPSLRLLLAAGAAPIPAGASPGSTPLMGAVLAGDTEAAELLIDAGAVQGTVPSPLLDTAVQMNNIRMVSLLVRKAHANVNQVNEQGMTPLTWAAITHHTDMARTLLDLGADAGFVDKFGCTALRHTADIWYTDPTTALTLKQASKQRLALASTYK